MQKTTPNPQMDAAKEAVKKQLLQALMQQVVTEITQKSPDEIAEMSREVIDGMDLGPVRDRISKSARLQLEARLAEEELEFDTSDIEERIRTAAEARIAEKLEAAVKPHLSISEDQVSEAVSQVEERVHETVAKMVTKRLDDTTRVVDEVLPAFGTENEGLLKAVEATRERLVGRVADQVVSRLQETDEIASMASSRISADDEAIQEAVLRSMELVLDDVIQHAEKRIQSSKTLATDARDRMMKVIPEVQLAADELEKLLIMEAASTATGRLSDADATAQAARTGMEDESAILRASEALHRQLTIEIADNSLRRVSDIEAASKAARKLIPDDHEALVRSQSRLRERLVDEIAERAVGGLNDIEKAATESYQLISPDLKQISEARSRVHSMVIDQIVRHTVEVLSDTETTAFSVVARVDSQHEVMQNIGDVVRRRLFESLLSTALADLGSKVMSKTEDGEQALFREALKSLASGGSQPATAAPVTPTPVSFTPQAPAPAPVAVAPVPQVAQAPSAPQSVTTATQAVQAPSATQSPQTPVASSPVAPSPVAEEADAVGWTRLSDLKRGIPDHPDSEGSSAAEPVDRSWKVSEIKLEGETDAQQPSLDSEKEHVIYVYGIMDTVAASHSEFDGIASIEPGIGVEIIDCGELFVVASKVSAGTYGREALKENMKDTEWVREQVRQHAGVLSEARAAGTIVPLRFGIVFESIDSVDEYINARSAHYLDAIERLHDRSEYGVRMHCSYEELRGALTSESARNSPIMQDVFDAFESMGTDGNDDEAYRLVLDTCIRRSHGLLEAQADESLVKQYDDSWDTDSSGSPLNATYLVSSGAESHFQNAVRTLADELEKFGMSFEVSGPWPPYHFVDVDSRKKGRTSTMIPA